MEGGRETLVICDVPGLIEGASSGKGLGLQFLRHVEKCSVILHIVDGSRIREAGPQGCVKDFVMINEELMKYDGILGLKPQIVVLNKIDLLEPEEKEEIEALLREEMNHSRLMSVSCMTKENVDALMQRLSFFVSKVQKADADGEEEKEKEGEQRE